VGQQALRLLARPGGRSQCPAVNFMAAQSPTGTAEENSSASTEEDNSETLLEAFTKAISGNPQFKEARKSGKAYVIAGPPADRK
jgi:hypothetical protein